MSLFRSLEAWWKNTHCSTCRGTGNIMQMDSTLSRCPECCESSPRSHAVRSARQPAASLPAIRAKAA